MTTKTQGAPISYRPSMGKTQFEQLVVSKLHYKVNRFLDEAVKEKLNRELVITSDPEMSRLISKVTEVILEHKGTKFLKPTEEIRRRIRAKATDLESGKVKGIRWKGSIDKTFGTDAGK
jgi:hypothetical protein